jgi:soluble lytic murein transglycosylase-like protein
MSERGWFTGRVVTFCWLVLALSPGAGYRSVYQGTTVAAAAADTAQSTAAPLLLPTAHPPIPSVADEFWLVPQAARAEANAALYKRLAEGIENIDDEEYAAALPKVSDPRLQHTPFADYAAYYTALAQLHTGHADQARGGFQKLRARELTGVLGEWTLVGEAQAAEAQSRFAEAAPLYEEAVARKAIPLDEMLAGLGRTQLASADREHALATFRRLYYEFPLSTIADSARQQILILTGHDESTRLKRDFELELGRAQRLFGAKRYAEALSAFDSLRDAADGDQRELIQLRMAEAQYYLGRYRVSLESTRPFIERASRKAEARFFYASSLRGTGDHANYIAEARKLIAEFPDSSWAEDALNNLGTHYILTSDDDAAIDVFRQYLDRFPTGRYAQRAAWKLGWTRYRQGDFQAAIGIFEQAAAHFPRSDYRPPYLYWTGRAYDRLEQADRANARYALVAVDYLNSYYGRLAETQLKQRNIGPEQRRALAVNPALSSLMAPPRAGAGAPASTANMPAASTTDAANVSAGGSGTDSGSGSGTGADDVPPAGAAAGTTGVAAGAATTAATASAASTSDRVAAVPASRSASASASGAASAPGAVAGSAAAGAASDQTGATGTGSGTASASARAASGRATPPDVAHAHIRQLIAASLYAPAAAEIEYAERTDGPSPRLEATLAWLYNVQGAYRKGIVAMKRAYPQYLSANGLQIPKAAQKVIFPIDYWIAIRKAATARGLDPFLIAALINQESAFDAGVRSSANAYGLMQVVPQTGKQLARQLKIRRFSTTRLTDPNINLQLGTLYFKNLLAQLGNVTYVLASYNAGESKVVRWIGEKRSLPQDEFIDDIPYPETQSYVKKILSTAEDYRRLYGS